MSGMVPVDTTQTTTPCVSGATGGVVTTDAGAVVFDGGSNIYRIDPGYLDADGNPVGFVLFELPLSHNGAPLEGIDPVTGTIPANGDYFYESAGFRATDYTFTAQITTDGTPSGRPIAFQARVDPIIPNGPTAFVRVYINNLQQPPTGGTMFNVQLVSNVSRYHITNTETCTPPPGNPVPVPVAPPTHTGRVTVNEQHPGLVVDWRRDNRWPDVVTINQQGLGVSIAHPRLTGAGARLMLLTGIEHQFKVRGNPPSWEVASTYKLERIPDTNIEGGHLFFTFDDDFAGFDTGILSD